MPFQQQDGDRHIHLDPDLTSKLLLPVSVLSQFKFKSFLGISLVAQWLRIHLPMQGTQVRSLVREDPTCRGATKPMRHNY